MLSLTCITIQQPWATLIARGQKWIENRPKPWHHRGLIAIHAGIGTRYLTRKQLSQEKYPAGCIIAVAELTLCTTPTMVRMKNRDLLAAEERMIGCGHTWKEIAQHKYGIDDSPFWLILENVRTLPTQVPATGRLGPWQAPDDVAAQVYEQLKAVPCC